MSDPSFPGLPRAWRRWEPASFGPRRGAAAAGEAAPAEADPAALERKLQSLFAAAQARGHAEGYAEGHAQGLAAGREAGHREGLAAGLEMGKKQGQAAAEAVGRQAAREFQQMADAGALALASLEQDIAPALTRLALRIARQIVRGTLAVQPERLNDLLTELLHLNDGEDGLLRLRLNPGDVALAERHLDAHAADRRWRLRPDPSIARGGCIVETALGEVDATLETRWRQVSAALGCPLPPDQETGP